MRYLIIFFIIFQSMQSIQVNAQSKSQQSVLRHVVMFGWSENTPAASIDKIVDAFKSLPGKIKEIKGFEWGINNSPEKLNQGLTHCFTLTFNSEKDRDTYLVHPDHQEFVKALTPAPTHVTVLDYWTK